MVARYSLVIASMALFALASPALEARDTRKKPAPPITAVQTKETQAAMTPDAALALLKEGNKRFVIGTMLVRDYVDAVAHANVDLTVKSIVNRSPVIADLIAKGQLKVVGAVHDVATGVVTFKD